MTTKVRVAVFEKKSKEIDVSFPSFRRDSDIFDNGAEYDLFEKLDSDLSFVRIVKIKSMDKSFEYKFECGQYQAREKDEEFFKGTSNDAEFREVLIELQEKLKKAITATPFC